jgi:hypothetical protein
MNIPVLDILLLSDLHYVHEAEYGCTIPERKCRLGLAALRGALRQLDEDGIEPHALILLGDLVDNGQVPGARADLIAVAEAAFATGLPVLAVPGNHDGDLGQFVRLFRCQAGLHEIEGHGFLVFHDRIAPDDVTTRLARDLALPARVARERPDLPLVALQHNPLHPPIDADYPYLIANAQDVLRSYDQAGVTLSLSGHYHKGQPAHPVRGVICYTVPAACEAPFRYAHIRLHGQEVEVYERSLNLESG